MVAVKEEEEEEADDEGGGGGFLSSSLFFFKKKEEEKGKKKKLRFRLPAFPHSELVPFGSCSRDKLTCVAFYTAENESR